MNPLTREARRDHAAERRQDTAICIGCGVVFAVLTILFFVK